MIKKNNILVFTNFTIEKLVFKTCLIDYNVVYIKKSDDYVNYITTHFKFIIVNYSDELITSVLGEWLLKYKKMHVTHIVYISSSLLNGCLNKIEYDTIIYKPYEMCEIISVIDTKKYNEF